MGEILDALEEVNPAFVRRFTRSADPAWAVFHTCCQQGILPPKKRGREAPGKATAPLTPPTEEQGRALLEREGWTRLSEEERLAQLLDFWHKAYRVHVRRPIEPDERERLSRELRGRIVDGASQETLECWLLEQVLERRGASPGPPA